MAGIIAMQRYFVRKILPAVNRRLVSTTKKKNETAKADILDTIQTKTENKNWVSYGYEQNSKSADRNAMHSIMFASVTICMVFGGFLLTYLPDIGLKDWAIREAFLELRRREALGLPRVDPNLIDPAKIQLPSDEELGDTEIVI